MLYFKMNEKENNVYKFGFRFLKGEEFWVCDLPHHPLPLKCNPNLNHMNYIALCLRQSFHSEQKGLWEIENRYERGIKVSP